MAKVYDNATDLITFARGSSGTALRRVGYGDDISVPLDQWVKVGDAATTLTYSAGDGSLEVDAASTLDGAIAALPGIEAGKVYIFEANFTLGTSGDFRLTVGPSYTNFVRRQESGTVQLVFTAQNTGVRIDSYTGTGTFTINSVSVREVFFDRATDDLVLFNHPDGMPRIEYGSDGSLKGLLIEEQRTNLVLDSNDPTTVNWATTTTTASQDLTGPDGVANSAWTLEDADIGAYSQNRVLLTIPAAATTYVTSFYVLKDSDETRFPEFQLQVTGGTSVRHFIRINTATGATTATQNNGGSYIDVEDCGNWWRISFDITNAGTNTALSLKILPVSSTTLAGSGNSSPTLTGSIGFYGIQIEVGDTPSSYIPTSGSQQTRSADVASIPVSAFGYNQQAGTVVVEFATLATFGSRANDGVLSLRDNSSDKHDLVRMYLSVSDNLTVQVKSNSSNVFATGIQTDLPEQSETKVAIGFTSGSYAASVDGGVAQSLSTNTAYPVAGEITELAIGELNGSDYLNGHIKSIQYYPRRLTNAQLQELTA